MCETLGVLTEGRQETRQQDPVDMELKQTTGPSRTWKFNINTL